MPGSLTLWFTYFNKLAFSRNGWRNPALSPYPFPEPGWIPWLNAYGKGVLNGKKWMSGQKASAHPFLCRFLEKCPNSRPNIRIILLSMFKPDCISPFPE
jgi:hypothetical protein